MNVTTSWDGFKWWIEVEHDKTVLSKGELSVLRALYTLPCSIFVDVGAHVGYYTIRMAKRCREVISFEPNPVNRRKLLKNIELNGLSNVKVYPYAAGEGRYKATLWLADAGSTMLPGFVAGESIEVEVVPLDELVKEADVVKIDVEGYEWKVIQGMTKLLNTCKPALIIEHHDFRHYGIRDYPAIRAFLRGMGYIELFLTKPHRLYYHRSKPLDTIKPLIADHWISHCIMNLEAGKPWYHGLPYTWWWGMNLIDFIHEIRDHVLRKDEPLWLERLF